MDGMASQLTDLNSSQNKITHLKQKLSRIDDSYNKMAGKLSVLRSKAAKQLDYIVVEELKYLKMPDCVFKTEILPVKIGSRGVDSVVFKVITNRGGEFGKLQAISSGGEMSRFLLALKVCLTDKEQGTTMIFDEIDRGIGGATADAGGTQQADEFYMPGKPQTLSFQGGTAGSAPSAADVIRAYDLMKSAEDILL